MATFLETIFTTSPFNVPIATRRTFFPIKARTRCSERVVAPLMALQPVDVQTCHR